MDEIPILGGVEKALSSLKVVGATVVLVPIMLFILWQVLALILRSAPVLPASATITFTAVVLGLFVVVVLVACGLMVVRPHHLMYGEQSFREERRWLLYPEARQFPVQWSGDVVLKEKSADALLEPGESADAAKDDR